MYYDQRALDIINEWEALEFRHPAQKKAALQIAIAAALSGSPQVEAGTVEACIEAIKKVSADDSEMSSYAAFYADHLRRLFTAGGHSAEWLAEAGIVSPGTAPEPSDFAHRLLGTFCACYAEAWPANTCKTESNRLTEWLAIEDRPREQERGEAPGEATAIMCQAVLLLNRAAEKPFLPVGYELGWAQRIWRAMAAVAPKAHPPLPADGWNYEEPKEDGWYWVWTKSPPQSHPAQAARFRAGDWLSNWDVIAWRLLPTPPASTEGGADADH